MRVLQKRLYVSVQHLSTKKYIRILDTKTQTKGNKAPWRPHNLQNLPLHWCKITDLLGQSNSSQLQVRSFFCLDIFFIAFQVIHLQNRKALWLLDPTVPVVKVKFGHQEQQLSKETISLISLWSTVTQWLTDTNIMAQSQFFPLVSSRNPNLSTGIAASTSATDELSDVLSVFRGKLKTLRYTFGLKHFSVHVSGKKKLYY